MKLLWVKAGGVLPLDLGGRIRSFHTVRELARRNNVTLYTFYEELAEDPHRDLGAPFAHVVTTPLRLPARRSLADNLLLARLQLRGRAYSMGKWYGGEVRRRIGELLRHPWDVIVCDFITPAGVLPWPGPCPTVLFTHNVEAEIFERQARLASNPLHKLTFWLEYKALARAERRYARLADHVLAVSERNAEFFAGVAGRDKVSVVPTGVDTDYFRPGPESGERDLVFTAAMDYIPNEDAALHFIAEILPRVPAARFWAVGRNPTGALKALASERVRVTGTVDDIRPYLRRAAVYVLPMRSGSGTRLKVFEAMAAGKAVVATPMGAEGLPVSHGENILLAETPAEFAGAVNQLLADAAWRARLGAAARRLVEERYSWAAAAAEFEKILYRTSMSSPKTTRRPINS